MFYIETAKLTMRKSAAISTHINCHMQSIAVLVSTCMGTKRKIGTVSPPTGHMVYATVFDACLSLLFTCGGYAVKRQIDLFSLSLTAKRSISASLVI